MTTGLCPECNCIKELTNTNWGYKMCGDCLSKKQKIQSRDRPAGIQ